MKANLPHLEPKILQLWDKIRLYHKTRLAQRGRPTFVLHDGPPYANGHIHLGHALNKILKDLIVKSKTMAGFDCPYVPGWDCHGLPIEIKVVGRKRVGLDPLETRQKCREYAQKYVEIQKEEFKRLGIFADWDNPYLTMSSSYEAETVRVLGKFLENGSVYRGLKPVHWCTFCETALAEAEVNYKQHVSLSIYVKFPVLASLKEISPKLVDRRVSALVWTTTPWTLPANLAICFHPEFDYSFVQSADEVYIVAQELLQEVVRECGFEGHQVLFTVKGKELKKLVFRHPWLNQNSRSLLANLVTLDQGTGVVHTAPGHGHEDYLLGLENGLEIYCPVDSSGRFTQDVEHFAGLPVQQATARIAQFIAEKGALVAEKNFEHSYPHCWRCHHPVIFRATPQWFISMQHGNLRKKALEAIKGVRWIPAWGAERISSMIAHRPDWCISRQRIWGVPITAFYCKSCNQPLRSSALVEHVADIFEKEGADAWYSRSARELLPENTRCPCGSTEAEKEQDILDVWFDSGSSHHVLLGKQDNLPWPADVYLEGGDQYRGWFHSSLLIALVVRNAAPYRTVVCNGWTLDSQGRAMSKSLGNVISPLDVLKTNGAEILRLWVASIHYTEDVRLGEEVLSRLREAYRKIRNTNRFLLGNLYDFDSHKALPFSALSELDRWALARLASVAEQAEKAYQAFEFSEAYRALHRFCLVDLSNFYLDILKDPLYISAPESPRRRAAQTTLSIILDTLVRLLAPILPFTTEEIWKTLHPKNGPNESVHLTQFSDQMDQYRDEALLLRWKPLRAIREKVNKAVEENRRNGHIGNSLEAKVTLHCSSDIFRYLQTFHELPYLFIVSQVNLDENQDYSVEKTEVVVSKATGKKCERCWHYSAWVGKLKDLPTICHRCHQILGEIGAITPDSISALDRPKG